MPPFKINGKRIFLDEIHGYLGESFSLTSTSFGTNIEIGHIFDDGNFLEKENEYNSFFRFNNHDYIVTMYKRNDDYWELSFASSMFNDGTPTDNTDHYTLGNYYTNDALNVLNRVLFIFGIVVKMYDIKKCKFGALDYKLKILYTSMIKNESFKNLMAGLGFQLIKTDEDYWYFEKT